MEYDEAHLDEVTLRAARRLSRNAESRSDRRGWYTLREWESTMSEALGQEIELRDDRGVAGRMIASGQVSKRPVKDSRSNLYRARGLDRPSLGTLMRVASQNRTSGNGQRGRRTTVDGSRDVERITEGQWTRMKTMANTLARYLHPEAARKKLTGFDLWDTVRDGSLWAWNDGAGGVSGWTRIRELIVKAAPAGRASTDRGAAELLLDLNATLEIIPRTVRHGGRPFVIPTGWAAVQERWLDVCRAAGIKGHHLGLQEILRAAADVMGPEGRLEAILEDRDEGGEGRCAYPTAERVLDRLRNVLMVSESINATQRAWIRATLRALMAAQEIPQIPIDRYDLRLIDRKRAWGSRLDRLIADAHANQWERRHEAWREFPFPRLADTQAMEDGAEEDDAEDGKEDNPYALRAAVEFFTATGQARSKIPFNSPPNVFPRPFSPRNPGDGDLWNEYTTKGNLTILSYFFGVLARFGSVDLQEIDLRKAFTVEHAQLVVDACVKHQFITKRMARDILIYIGLISSPYLERVALAHGESDLANRFFDLAAETTGHGKVKRLEDGQIVFEGMTLRDQLSVGRGDKKARIAEMRQSSKQVQRVWEKNLGVAFAFEGMELVYQAAKSVVLTRLGAESVSELEERWKEVSPNRSSLCDLRALSFWNDLMAAPMRPRALVEQTMAHRVSRRGTLRLDTPAELHKVPENGPYCVTLWDGPGSGYDIVMWRLYEGRVRDALLAGQTCDRVYVNDMRAPNAKYAGILTRTVNYMIRRVIDLAGPTLEYKDGSAFAGAGSAKAFRHAIGSFLVAHNKAEEARVLLHHKGLDMLMEVYADRSERVSTGQERASLRSDAETEMIVRSVRERPDLIELIKAELSEKGDA